MKYTLNVARLADLLKNLHEITQLKISLHDTNGAELHSTKSRSTFCNLICSLSAGYQRCLACDRHAVSSLAPPYAPVQYRCHAGLIDTVIPITEGGEVVATILFGQILDDTPFEKQWADTKALCAWYPDPAALKEAFTRVPQLSGNQIRACYEIINACVSEIRLESLMKVNAQTDAEKLALYIREHFSESLTIASISQALSISKSKLYLLAAQIEPGLTICEMILRRRIAAAKHLLIQPDATVRDVAEKVGIPDYNYFAKVFKKAAHMTPSQYQKYAAQPQPDTVHHV